MTERIEGNFHFPTLPKKSIEDLWHAMDANDEFTARSFIEMANNEPVLSASISEVFSTDRFSESFCFGALSGATLTWKALKETDMPIVSLETVETLIWEWLGSSPDFNRPTPFTYCEENPALMTFLLIQDSKVPGFATGGTFMYELHRRQLHSNNISSQI